MAKADLYIKDIAKRVVMEVDLRGMKEWTLRMKIATWLIRLAGHIAWLSVKVLPPDVEGEK